MTYFSNAVFNLKYLHLINYNYYNIIFIIILLITIVNDLVYMPYITKIYIQKTARSDPSDGHKLIQLFALDPIHRHLQELAELSAPPPHLPSTPVPTRRARLLQL
jgi:hypothetical protein